MNKSKSFKTMRVETEKTVLTEQQIEEIRLRQKKQLQDNLMVTGRLMAGIEQQFLDQSLGWEKQQELTKKAIEYGEVLNYLSQIMQNRFVIPEQMAEQQKKGYGQRPGGGLIQPVGNA